jgi:L-2-hydroxyglutarate oxidase LhgO
MTGGTVRRIAPIRALGGLFIPSVCVVDVESLAESMTLEARAAGAQFFYNQEVVGVEVAGPHHVIHTNADRVAARVLINSAGLHAHEISKMAGGPQYEIEFIRGDYYELKGGIEKWGIRTLVYPAMPPRSRSKGIHFGPRTNGRLYIGPSATPPSQPAEKSVFLDAARRFIPEIRDEDLEWAYFGLRPKRAAPGDKADFSIRLERPDPPFINLIGIDSPGLSASMGIAGYVAKLLKL